MTWEVICSECLSYTRTMASNSVDLIATDPPYFKVKNEPWDRQWDKPDQFVAWVGELCEEWQRVLKPNGSLYVFASPKMAARVEVTVGRWFNVLDNLTWVKPDPSCDINNGAGRGGQCSKDTLRAWFPRTEEIVFAEHYGADNIAKGEAGYAAKCDELRGFLFEPLRGYLDGERERASVDKADCNAACGFSRSAGGMASRHYFSPSQWCLPTRDHYRSLQRLFNAQGGDDLKREYDDLRQEYESLRRPFAVTADVPYTHVWTFPTVSAYPGKHPCEKPKNLMAHIIKASSRPGAVVFDPFCGSGTTGVAAVELGRNFIGVEQSERWAIKARERIGATQTTLWAA